ncbi:wax synthase family protein [Aspergillus undulatus]|uniref:wax synthase family protein n=1 Tax=Aspergillus undulatus TaxID=1810928 RepID=UPI003CCDE534
MVDLGAAFARYERIVLDTHERIELLIRNGDAKSLLIWHALIPMILPICALLIPRRRGGWILRQVLYAITLGTCVEIIRFRRVLLGGNGYMVGLMVVWWLIWSATLLFFNDAERDFRRIERVPTTKAKDAAGKQDGHASKEEHLPDEAVRDAETLVWQSYPRSFWHRVGWTIALVLNMRGPDFSFRISSLDPLPTHLDAKTHSANEERVCPQAKPRIRAAFIRFFIAYLAIDLLKLIMIWDPYFFGSLSAEPPFPFDHLLAFPVLVRVYRSLVSGTGVYFAVLFVTALNPIFFLGPATAFPDACRAITATPLDAPWLYADQFGPLSIIQDAGLAGAWGKWWHQIFRFGFVSTGKWIISFFPPAISSQRNIRRIIVTLVAFGLSGSIHAAGSYTQLGDTHPLSGPFTFFALQAVGIFVQELWSSIIVARLARLGLPLPRWLRRLGNLVFVLVWLYFSGNRIADDFARGGLWLTEPLPVSPLRGLMGYGWNCWRMPWFEYADDGTYWWRGVRVI